MPIVNMQATAVANEMYEAACRSRGRPRAYLGMSSIGNPCELAVWYGFRGYTPKPAEGRAMMIFDLGSRVEDAVIHWLELAGYRIEGRQDTFSDFGGFFCGHCDGIIHGVTQRPHILEIKSANDKKFEAFKRSGVGEVYPEYAAQIQCYMGYAGLERALWVIMNKNTCEIYTERAYFNPDEFARLKAKAERIITAQDKQSLVIDTTRCRWCSFAGFCHGGGVQTARSCTSCAFFSLKGLTPRCTFTEHPYEIKDRSLCCGDYLFLEEYDFFKHYSCMAQ